MPDDTNKARAAHQHGGKSSESRMNKEAILQSLSITAGQVILDAGCGNGYMAKEFALLTGDAGRVYALDPNEEAIDVLKSETAGSCIDPFVGDITEQTPIEAASLDLIYLSMVFHGFSQEQQQGFCREVQRLLKPGGRLAVVEIKKEPTPSGPPMQIRFSPEELQQVVDLTPIRTSDAGAFCYLQIFQK